ncbi:unnamed protein product [Rhizoctonia solani]|uniref:BTB domain-containing protein n=1 Tax=Rhizoctonia solani TaxID=456999 RepID=A0A8H2XA37_9AGAM|nr:unnamed protein product [Rhizoctonia solani]
MSAQVDVKVAPPPNNPVPSDLPATPAARAIIRDSTYYLDDGSTILLIGNTLFKIHLSILVPSIGPNNYDYDSCLRLLIGNPGFPSTGKGASDADPLAISTLSARQFRHLLLALLGRPGDPFYMALLTDAKDRCRHTQEVFIRYLDIGNLDDRLHMWNLADWAHHQLELLLKSASQLIEKSWDAETVVQIATFGKTPDEEFSNQLHVFLRRILTPNPCGNLAPHDLSLCVSLYGSLGVLTISQELFGWAFLLVLSLGHRSATWSTKLAREDRLILYAAQAEMVKLSEYTPLGISWLVQPRQPTNGLLHLSCSLCSARCADTWDTTFGKLGTLQSAMPLDDVRQLIHLPRYRQMFAKAISSTSWPCKEKCGEAILQSVDARINKMCQSLSEIHADLVKTPGGVSENAGVGIPYVI